MTLSEDSLVIYIYKNNFWIYHPNQELEYSKVSVIRKVGKIQNKIKQKRYIHVKAASVPEASETGGAITFETGEIYWDEPKQPTSLFSLGPLFKSDMAQSEWLKSLVEDNQCDTEKLYSIQQFHKIGREKWNLAWLPQQTKLASPRSSREELYKEGWTWHCLAFSSHYFPVLIIHWDRC